MKLHPYMVEAIYLRTHPSDIIQHPDGREFWFNEISGKYYWSNPRSKTRTGTYLASGLMVWWEKYLERLEDFDVRMEDDRFE